MARKITLVVETKTTIEVDADSWIVDYGLDADDLASVEADVRNYFVDGLSQELRDLNSSGALAYKIKDSRGELLSIRSA